MVDAAPLTLWALLIDSDAGTDHRKYRVCLACPELLHVVCQVASPQPSALTAERQM